MEEQIVLLREMGHRMEDYNRTKQEYAKPDKPMDHNWKTYSPWNIELSNKTLGKFAMQPIYCIEIKMTSLEIQQVGMNLTI